MVKRTRWQKPGWLNIVSTCDFYLGNDGKAATSVVQKFVKCSSGKQMNIYVLDEDVELCARYHCDQHIVKMIMESVQIMCTALNKQGFITPYRSTHPNHPCVRWVEESYDNFLWLGNLALALNEEYRYRFDNSEGHRALEVFDVIRDYRYDSVGRTEFAQAIPEEYRIPGEPVAAYRHYYATKALETASWIKRPIPDWISNPEFATPAAAELIASRRPLH